MAYVLTVYDETGESRGLVFRTSWYAFEDGSRLQVDEQVAWCADCQQFTLAEDLMTPERKARQIEEGFWSLHPDERTQFWYDALRYRQQKALAERKPWFDYLAPCRRSPPRCLECGLTRIAALDPRSNWGEWVPHPARPRRVQVKCLGHIDTGRYDVFTPEGMRCVR